MVETLKDGSVFENLPDDPTGLLTLEIRQRSGFQKVGVSRSWLSDLRERRTNLSLLEAKAAEDCLLHDISYYVGTASKVVLLLWSALEVTFDLDYKTNEEDLITSIMFYAPMCGLEQQFIPYLKYQLSYLFAKGEGQIELPNKLESGHKDGTVLMGWLGRFFKSRAFGKKTINKEWRNTILHGIKKGLPKMGEFHLRKNADSMIKRLCPDVPRKTPDDLLDQIYRTAKEVFPEGINFDDWKRVDRFTSISDHCSYERTRMGRGVMGTLIKHSGLKTIDRALCPDQLGGMYYNPTLYFTGEVRFPGWCLTSEYMELRKEALEDPSCGKAKVKPIFEPLKIRMITAGDYKSNGLYSSLQKKLWGGLQKFEQFALTGKPVSVQDISRLYDMTQRLPVCFRQWVSGDYSAATDNLNRDASKMALLGLSGDLMTYSVLCKGLMDTEIDMNSCGLDEEFPIYKMTSGQLMGCVFSFPILCIINLAVYRYALEVYTDRKYKIRHLPVRVNGDDILFLSNKGLRRIWEQMIKEVGFEKSVGKNYVSRDFAIINSVYFDTTNIENIRKIPYWNMGWVSGERKTGLESLDGKERLDDVWCIKDQVKQTKHDWAESGEFLCNEKNHLRRLESIDRFRRQIKFWRFRSIISSGYSCIESPGGLDLDPFLGTLGYDDELSGTYEEAEFLCSIYQLLNLDRGPSLGLPEFPKTKIPWKLCGVVQEEDQFKEELLLGHWALLRLRTKYFRMRSPYLNRKILDQYRSCEYRKIIRDSKNAYVSLGQLLQ